MLETLRKINLCLELPAGLSVVCLTVVIFGVVGLGFSVVASKSIIQMIFSTLDVYCIKKQSFRIWLGCQFTFSNRSTSTYTAHPLSFKIIIFAFIGLGA